MMRIGAFLLAALALAPAPAAAQSDLAAVEARLQRVEDELAIQRVITEYAVRLDAKDIDGYLELFAEDGIWQVGTTQRRGREEIRAMLEGLYGQTEVEPYGYEQFRMVGNFQIEVDGDRATARSRHVEYIRGERGNPDAILSGLYVDEFVREGGAWKIAHRTDYPIMPTAEEWREQVPEIRARQEAGR
jgi:uncharacterized protein (TIGR02246 family)